MFLKKYVKIILYPFLLYFSAWFGFVSHRKWQKAVKTILYVALDKLYFAFYNGWSLMPFWLTFLFLYKWFMTKANISFLSNQILFNTLLFSHPFSFFIHIFIFLNHMTQSCFCMQCFPLHARTFISIWHDLHCFLQIEYGICIDCMIFKWHEIKTKMISQQ